LSGNDPREVVEALAAHEDAVGDLYDLYAFKFPHAADLWRSLASEEYGHARLIRGLAERAADADPFSDEVRFDLQEVHAAVSDVREQAQLAEGPGGVDLRTALQTAVQIEDEMFESRAFAVFAADTPQIGAALERLRVESERHAKRLRERLEALKSHG
jgi:rubrerythrin